MIFFLSKKQRLYTIKLFLETLGKDLAERVRLLPYEKLFRMKTLPVGTYIFADLERLTPEETDQATIVWNTLAESGRDVRLLNHPARSMRRFELLRHLYDCGINDFNVYRVTDIDQPRRFPVFVRTESDHNGSMTTLLHTQAELRDEIDNLTAEGHNRDNKITVEFTDVADERGVYHLYQAFIVGSKIVALGLELSYDWINKGESFPSDDEFVNANQRYVETNPHESLLRPVFELARIEYGRMDYAVVDGQIRVFEINTNPYVIENVALEDPVWQHATERYSSNVLKSLQEIDNPERPVRCIRVTPRREPPAFNWRYQLRMLVYETLRILHLLKHEASIMSMLRRVERHLFKRDSD